MKQIKVSLPRHLLVWVQHEAKRRLIPESAVIREMVNEHYERAQFKSKGVK